MKIVTGRRVVVAAATLVAAVIVGFLLVARHADHSVREARQACLDAGMANSLDELLGPEVANDDNAALLYVEACRMWATDPTWPKTVHGQWTNLSPERRDSLWSPAERVAARQIVDHYAEALRLIHEGAEKPHCRFDVSLDPSVAISPRASDIVALSRVAGMRVWLLADDGRLDEAAEATTETVSLAEKMAAMPTWMFLALRGYVLGIATHDVLRLTVDAPLADPQRSRLLALTPDRGAICAQAQRAASLDRLSAAYAGFGPVRSQTAMPGRILVNLDEACYLRRIRQVYLWAGRGSQASPELSPEEPPRVYSLSYLLCGMETSLRGPRDKAVAAAEQLRIVLWLDRHRAESGAFPERLADLHLADGETLPDDPYSGDPYRYERTAAGFRLWSAGKDATDNGGHGDDVLVTFPLERAPTQGASQKSSPQTTDWNRLWQERVRRAREQSSQGTQAPADESQPPPAKGDEPSRTPTRQPQNAPAKQPAADQPGKVDWRAYWEERLRKAREQRAGSQPSEPQTDESEEPQDSEGTVESLSPPKSD